MTALLTKVRSTTRLRANERAWQLLGGLYASRQRERSPDFDDLREYAGGDDARDIDWVATARSHAPLIRRHVASRRHLVWLAVDTGRAMAAHNTADVTKRDIAITVAGVLGGLASQQGDPVGMVAGNRHDMQVTPPRTGDAHLERLLRHVHDATSVEAAPTSLARMWGFLARAARRSAIVVLICDDHELSQPHETLLRRLATLHSVYYITVADAPVCGEGWARAYDVISGARMPAFARDAQLLAEQAAADAERTRRRSELLDSLGIHHAHVTHPDDVVRDLMVLLGRAHHAR